MAGKKEEFKRKTKTLNWETSDVQLLVNQKAPFLNDPELYKTLNIRLIQDKLSYTHSVESYIECVNIPLIFNNRVVRENKISDESAYKNNVNGIRKFGDATGLQNESIHEQMESYCDTCPNPYVDYVYNIEVADHHTYFVGHDAIWVRG